jgi:MoaA/NifB/PqqE/SkfB family radical SAM enzyme
MDVLPEAVDPPFMRNIGLLLTYHCQASCSHCVIRAGPDRHEEVDLDDARSWIQQIARYRDHYVCVLSLTGGEPFSNLKLLRAVMECAAENDLYVSVVTNGFWAVRREQARQLLQSLPQICFLSISTDVYHQEYVPFERVANAIRAAQDCGIPFYVTVVTEDAADAAYEQIRAQILQLTTSDRIRTGITFPVGRAARIKAQLRYRLGEDPPREACQAASSPCIFPDGRVYGCIGPLIDLRNRHPLLLGNLRETSLAEILDASETNVVLHALRLWGPSRLAAFLRDAGLGKRLPMQYVQGSVCNACFSLLADSVLRERLSQLERDPELRRKVAYGRLFYLNETAMLEIGGFRDSESSDGKARQA